MASGNYPTFSPVSRSGIGERPKERSSRGEGLKDLLFIHSSQQREERTKKRRRGYRAFGFVAAVAVGVCGTRFARTVLALFPPSSLRLHRPIKAESGDLACILTPSPCGHFPYIPLQKYRGGRGGLILLLSLRVFLTPLLVATLLSSPLCFRKKI